MMTRAWPYQEVFAMRELKIALVQMKCEKGEVAENLSSIEKYIMESKKRDIEIICFPEMSIPGYINPSRYQEAVLSAASTPVKQIAEWSKRYNIVIIVGFIEENPKGKPFITQIAAQNGDIVSLYRKKTVIDEEAEWFSAGDDYAIFTYNGIKIGLSICADIEDENIFREYGKQGAQIVFECAAPGLYGEQSTRNWQSGFAWWENECCSKLGRYARENRIYITVSTQAGRTVDEDFPGGGYVFSPEGECINETADWEEGILFATVKIG